MRSFTMTMATLAIALFAAPAFAQDDDVQCHLAPGSRTVVCDEILIEGDAPRAFVLLGRTRDRYEQAALERDLTREIPRTVRHAPF